MIDVHTALDILAANAVSLAPKALPLYEAAGLTLAADLTAPLSLPAFRQSAMDGYAFAYEGWQHQPLTVVGELPAGADGALWLLPGQAARIFTGAPVPEGADTVVVQERTTREGDQLYIMDDGLRAGANVRPAGSEIYAGERALPAGSRLTPAAIGLAASLGLPALLVYPAPRVRIVVTGSELQTPGNPLRAGQVYESNSFSLVAALQSLGVKDVVVRHAPDDPELITQALREALQEADLLLVTGGVSVGDYDYVVNALDRCGVVTLFHRVKQKPAKPLYAGRWGNTPVFGLPGNPASVLTCFYEYVSPVIAWRMQQPDNRINLKKLPLAHDYEKAPGYTHFLKGESDGREVRLLAGQESYKLNTFARANCLVTLEAGSGRLKAGDEVAVHFIS